MTVLARARVCQNCADGRAHVTRSGRETGFVLCKHMPDWQWRSGTQPCQFQPSRWIERPVPTQGIV